MFVWFCPSAAAAAASSSSSKANKSPLPQRLFCIQNTSDDSVNVTFNSPLNKSEATNDACRDDTGETDERSKNSQAIAVTATTAAAAAATVAATAKTTKRSSKTFFMKKDKAPKRNTTNNNNEAHGFISSFNQLTSNNLPVITSATTTMLKHITSNKCDKRDNHHECTIDDSDELSAKHNSAIILNKKCGKDDRSKYSKCSD